jgi:hypothetical protein
MLYLILPYRHIPRLIDENICRLENGVARLQNPRNNRKQGWQRNFAYLRVRPSELPANLDDCRVAVTLRRLDR